MPCAGRALIWVKKFRTDFTAFCLGTGTRMDAIMRKEQTHAH